MRDENTYRVSVNVMVTDMGFARQYSFGGSVEVDTSQLNDLGYIVGNIASPLGRSASMATLRGESLPRFPDERVEPLNE